MESPSNKARKATESLEIGAITFTTGNGNRFEPGQQVTITTLSGKLDGEYTITKVQRNVHSIMPNRWYHYPLNWCLRVYWKAWGIYWKLRSRLSQ